jgi:hypothetical protein
LERLHGGCRRRGRARGSRGHRRTGDLITPGRRFPCCRSRAPGSGR